jgi:hypothetical protein
MAKEALSRRSLAQVPHNRRLRPQTPLQPAGARANKREERVGHNTDT